GLIWHKCLGIVPRVPLGGILAVTVGGERLFGPPEQHRGRRELFAPRRRARAYVPASTAERADGRGHRAHELVQSRAHEGAQTLPEPGRDTPPRPDGPAAGPPRRRQGADAVRNFPRGERGWAACRTSARAQPSAPPRRAM